MPPEPGGRHDRILVVDDEFVTRTMIRGFLEEAGAEVIEAASGEEAIERFHVAAPRLVLLDVRMPGMDGLATCRALRALPGGAAIPIVMLTGSDDVATIRGSYDAGATDFEAKTVNLLVLWQRIRYLLRANEAANRLRDSEARLAAAERIARTGSWQWSLESGQHRWSPGLHALLAVPADAPLDHERFLERVHTEEREAVRRALTDAAQAGRGYAGDHRLIRTDGVVLDCHLEARPGVVVTNGAGMTGTVQDVSELRSAEHRLHQLAFYDQCTGLPNRNLLRLQLQRILDAAGTDGGLAVMFLDLDNFKDVNDTLGHSAGDTLLAQVSVRLREVIRSGDLMARADGAPGPLVARHGGDEFVACLVGIERPEQAARVAVRLLDVLARPFTILGRELRVTASVGISLAPADGTDAETLLKHADAAMYDAKAAGRNVHRFFNPELSARALHRLTMEAALRHALEHGELVLEYQPLINWPGPQMVGAESLVRWDHPELGLVPPGEFVPLAEESGLVLLLDRWVLETATKQAAAWRRAGNDWYVSVNISGRQFWQPGLIAQVRGALDGSGLDPAALCLEITEGALIRDAATALVTLQRLKELGVLLAIDDFGTGSSSLQYLRQFPVDQLKLDRSFVRDVDRNPRDAGLTAAVYAMAKVLELEPLAEGVERESQRDVLAAQGYRLMQGYLFGRPAAAAHLARGFTSASVPATAG